MKKTEFLNIKKLEIKDLKEKIKQFKKEINDLFFDKKMNKLKDVKAVSKKKKDLARILTVLKQKQLVEELEKEIENQKPKIFKKK